MAEATGLKPNYTSSPAPEEQVDRCIANESALVNASVTSVPTAPHPGSTANRLRSPSVHTAHEAGPIFPPPPIAPETDALSPVSVGATDSSTLYTPTSPLKHGSEELPETQTIETHSGTSLEKRSLLKRLLGHKLVLLLLTYVSPLAGLTALAFAVCHILACFVILCASNNAPVANWAYAPQVYLAILTAIANKALAFAVVQGTVVTWWLKAMRGTTLAQLHYDWAVGLHVWQAIGAGRHFSVLAFACLCATFVAIDGPLLQSASSVKPKVPTETVWLEVAMVPQIPSYFSGWSAYPPLQDGNSAGEISGEYYPIMKSFLEDEPMHGFITGCEGTCTTTLFAPALELISCDTWSMEKDYTLPMTPEEADALQVMALASPVTRTVFGASASTNLGSREMINITLGMTDEDVTRTCKGKLNGKSCLYASAIGEYPVRIQDGNVNFLQPPSHPKIVALANNTALTDETIETYGLASPEGGYIRTSLSGIAQSLNIDILEGPAIMLLIANNTPTLFGGDYDLIFKYMSNWARVAEAEDCAPAWISPQDGMLAVTNELMFRTGYYTAQQKDASWLQNRLDPGMTVYHSVTGIPTSSVNVFVTDWRYFAGAATLDIVTILAFPKTFYGWWRLNLERSLSPLEIAKAFDAPLLREFESDQKG